MRPEKPALKKGTFVTVRMVAQMRRARAYGESFRQIAQSHRVSKATAHRHTRDVRPAAQ